MALLRLGKVKVCPCWNHSYDKQEYEFCQSAKLSHYTKVPFCKSSPCVVKGIILTLITHTKKALIPGNEAQKKNLITMTIITNQLSSEATDVGSWSFMGSNGPVRNESMMKWYIK